MVSTDLLAIVSLSSSFSPVSVRELLVPLVPSHPVSPTQGRCSSNYPFSSLHWFFLLSKASYQQHTNIWEFFIFYIWMKSHCIKHRMGVIFPILKQRTKRSIFRGRRRSYPRWFEATPWQLFAPYLLCEITVTIAWITGTRLQSVLRTFQIYCTKNGEIKIFFKISYLLHGISEKCTQLKAVSCET